MVVDMITKPREAALGIVAQRFYMGWTGTPPDGGRWRMNVES
jgi:hypothetical protein